MRESSKCNLGLCCDRIREELTKVKRYRDKKKTIPLKFDSKFVEDLEEDEEEEDDDDVIFRRCLSLLS